MRCRALIWLFLAGFASLQTLPARACTEALNVSVNCSPSPTPTGSPRKPDPPPTASSADTTAKLFASIKAARQRRGLAPLSFDATVSKVAKAHAERMARAGRIYHNGALTSWETRRVLGDPDVLLENVGYGPTSKKIHRAFMRSASHRRVILHPAARVVGIGVVRRDGSLWISQVLQDRHAPGGRAASPVVGQPPKRANNDPARRGPAAEGAGEAMAQDAEGVEQNGSPAPAPKPGVMLVTMSAVALVLWGSRRRWLRGFSR